MARPGLTQHRKFLRLSRLLGSAPLALGCLELIWEKCYQNGEAYLGDELDVEAAAQWPGQPGALCRALVEAGGEGNAGFIEQVEGRPGHFQCHDLFDHAPRYVGKRLQREIERKEKGTTLHDLRVQSGRKGAQAKANGKQMDDHLLPDDQQTDSKRQQVERTPAPAPAPAPAPSTSSLRSEESAELPAAPPTPLPLPEVGGGDLVEQLIDHWNTVCGPAGLPKVLQQAQGRRSRLKALFKARLKDKAFEQLFREACDYIAHHPSAAWMRGQGERHWLCTLDYLLKPGRVEKHVEEARAAPRSRAAPTRAASADASFQSQVEKIDWASRKLPTAAGAP